MGRESTRSLRVHVVISVGIPERVSLSYVFVFISYVSILKTLRQANIFPLSLQASSLMAAGVAYLSIVPR